MLLISSNQVSLFLKTPTTCRTLLDPHHRHSSKTKGLDTTISGPAEMIRTTTTIEEEMIEMTSEVIIEVGQAPKMIITDLEITAINQEIKIQAIRTKATDQGLKGLTLKMINQGTRATLSNRALINSLLLSTLRCRNHNHISRLKIMVRISKVISKTETLTNQGITNHLRNKSNNHRDSTRRENCQKRKSRKGKGNNLERRNSNTHSVAVLLLKTIYSQKRIMML